MRCITSGGSPTWRATWRRRGRSASRAWRCSGASGIRRPWPTSCTAWGSSPISAATIRRPRAVRGEPGAPPRGREPARRGAGAPQPRARRRADQRRSAGSPLASTRRACRSSASLGIAGASRWRSGPRATWPCSSTTTTPRSVRTTPASPRRPRWTTADASPSAWPARRVVGLPRQAAQALPLAAAAMALREAIGAAADGLAGSVGARLAAAAAPAWTAGGGSGLGRRARR